MYLPEILTKLGWAKGETVGEYGATQGALKINKTPVKNPSIQVKGDMLLEYGRNAEFVRVDDFSFEVL